MERKEGSFKNKQKRTVEGAQTLINKLKIKKLKFFLKFIC